MSIENTNYLHKLIVNYSTHLHLSSVIPKKDHTYCLYFFKSSRHILGLTKKKKQEDATKGNSAALCAEVRPITVRLGEITAPRMALSRRSRLKSRVSPSPLPPSSPPLLAPFLFGSPLIPPRAQELPSQPSLPVSSGLCCLHPHQQEIPAESRRHNRSRFTLT